MFAEIGGRYYYIDEESFAERMTRAQAETDREHPWQIEDIVEIQHRMKSLEDRLFEHLKATATPDPIDTLRRHLDEMVANQAGV